MLRNLTTVIRSVRPRLTAWLATLRARWRWGLGLVLYKIVEDWVIGEAKTALAGKSGLIVTVVEWIIRVLPWATWFVGIPVVLCIILYRAYRDSAEYRAQLEREQEKREQSPKGFLDHRVDAEEASKQLAKLIERLGDSSHKMTRYFERVTPVYKSAKTAKRQLRIASRLASAIDKHAKTIEKLVPRMKRSRALFSDGYLGWFRWDTPTTPEERKILRSRRQTIVETRQRVTELQKALAGVQESKQVLKQASRDLHGTLTRHDEVIKQVQRVVSDIRETCTKLMRIIDEKIRKPK